MAYTGDRERECLATAIHKMSQAHGWSAERENAELSSSTKALDELLFLLNSEQIDYGDFSSAAFHLVRRYSLAAPPKSHKRINWKGFVGIIIPLCLLAAFFLIVFISVRLSELLPAIGIHAYGTSADIAAAVFFCLISLLCYLLFLLIKKLLRKRH